MIKRSLLLSLLLVTGSLQAQDQAPDLAKAKQTAETICAACHAADGNSQLSANPKIAGQHADYLFKQLREFKSWDGKPAVRDNAVMGAMVAGLDEADMKGLAVYFAGQKLVPEAAKNLDTVERGQKIWRAGIPSKGVPACAACHGPAGAGLPAQYPALAGQFAEYTEAQLKAFRDEVRANDPNKMMRMIAIKMTDPEIKAVADYAAGLR
ncbi:c-type cytochrome [Azoarcus communis]|uniref:Cytochrome c4 n=1 Tax=Parazoarcus communis SWub3 = DSM 12120 TaxID=1121029 RepID=A0A323UX78_9RHOO|nr:c-type cytochrome [Parazoarcus communis]NMG46641.1 c-type cytochrome [Parazoarcus communis]NMG68975.1 c-type cytochrome [Parazoarcus communis SWub3 = DSM 12120]PZA16841.1 cytochrome c4 [Azoarcus communis] [Parazoarcus communis SWub3 = DSM 12120]